MKKFLLALLTAVTAAAFFLSLIHISLDSMEDPILHLAVHLTLVGALREGEVAGRTPEDIDFDAANGMGTFTVNRSMQRVQKDTLAQVDKGCILRIFPDKLEAVSYTHLDVYKRQR